MALIWQILRWFGIGILLTLTACSGGTSDSTPLAGSTQNVENTDAGASAAATNGDATGSDDDPHCFGTSCPRQITPTTWVDYHNGPARLLSSISDTQVLSANSTHFQLWDLDDNVWGRSVFLDDAEIEVNINAIFPLGGTRFATRPLGDNAPQLVVYDVAASDPTTPLVVIDPGSDVVRKVTRLTQNEILVKTGSGSSSNETVAVWSLESGDVLHQLDDVATSVASSATGDIYFTNENKELWRWQPPAAPELVSSDTAMPIQGPFPMEVGPSGRVLMARSNQASVFDPNTNTTVALSGVEPDDDPARFRTIAIGELPDGRIVAAYPDARIAYWDPASPDTPTIETLADVRSLEALVVLPDGRLLFSTSPENSVDAAAIQVITPPTP